MEKENKNYKTFTVSCKDKKLVSYFTKAILRYKHLENMINIILNDIYCETLLNYNYEQKKSLIKGKPEFTFEIFNLITNPITMKAVVSNNCGGEKTRSSILKCKMFLQKYYPKLLESILNEGKILNDKNISQIFSRIKKDWNNYFKNKRAYFDRNLKSINQSSLFCGQPKPPKPKKLGKIYTYSVPLEVSKFSLNKKNKIGINLYKKMIYAYFPENKYLKNKIINNVLVLLNHKKIELKITYIDQSLNNESKINNKILNKKYAGLDIGVYNLFSIVIDDDESKSIIYSNNKMIKYNCSFNKNLKILNKNLSKQRKKSTESNTEVLEYTDFGKSLKNKINIMYYKRNNYFEGEMQKISKRLLCFLKSKNVTNLVISKNLSFAKNQGKIKQGKKTSQKFFQIPFGRFLNLLEEKAYLFGIEVHIIDEAYTSKTSSISASINYVQDKNKKESMKKKEKRDIILPNELNGVRGKKGSRISNGLFNDTLLNKIFNADLNAALNHIKVFSKKDFYHYKKKLWKLCNPINIKSAHDFDLML